MARGAYTFTIGYHELAGTRVTLKKPLLVLRKKKNDGQGGPAAAVELDVIGVIRHKILFKDRPKALISKVPVKEKKFVDRRLTYPMLSPSSLQPPPESLRHGASELQIERGRP
nr:uncharacterized protein LOC127301397 [Lolium perenne]